MKKMNNITKEDLTYVKDLLAKDLENSTMGENTPLEETIIFKSVKFIKPVRNIKIKKWPKQCIDYTTCESKKCKTCQRNAIIRICACCSLVYIGNNCPFCEFGASYGAYFVIGNWFKVLYRLLFRIHRPKNQISFMN